MKRLLLFVLSWGWLAGQAQPAEVFSVDRSGKIRTNPEMILPIGGVPVGILEWRTVGDVPLAGMPEYWVRVDVDAFEDPEVGFNAITILRNGNELLSLRDCDMWTYLYDGKCTIDLRRFANNRYFIQERLSDDLTLLLFVGWPYASDPPLLTIVALSGNEAAVVYNQHADIEYIFRDGPLFVIDVSKAVIEYDEHDNPCGDGDPRQIFYVDGHMREVSLR